MKYKITYTAKFKRDFARAVKRGVDPVAIQDVISSIAAGFSLDAKYKDHALKGRYIGCRECHITPDLLLIYEISEAKLILYLIRTGTHSDLF